MITANPIPTGSVVGKPTYTPSNPTAATTNSSSGSSSSGGGSTSNPANTVVSSEPSHYGNGTIYHYADGSVRVIEGTNKSYADSPETRFTPTSGPLPISTTSVQSTQSDQIKMVSTGQPLIQSKIPVGPISASPFTRNITDVNAAVVGQQTELSLQYRRDVANYAKQNPLAGSITATPGYSDADVLKSKLQVAASGSAAPFVLLASKTNELKSGAANNPNSILGVSDAALATVGYGSAAVIGLGAALYTNAPATIMGSVIGLGGSIKKAVTNPVGFIGEESSSFQSNPEKYAGELGAQVAIAEIGGRLIGGGASIVRENIPSLSRFPTGAINEASFRISGLDIQDVSSSGGRFTQTANVMPGGRVVPSTALNLPLAPPVEPFNVRFLQETRPRNIFERVLGKPAPEAYVKVTQLPNGGMMKTSLLSNDVIVRQTQFSADAQSSLFQVVKDNKIIRSVDKQPFSGKSIITPVGKTESASTVEYLNDEGSSVKQTAFGTQLYKVQVPKTSINDVFPVTSMQTEITSAEPTIVLTRDTRASVSLREPVVSTFSNKAVDLEIVDGFVGNVRLQSSRVIDRKVIPTRIEVVDSLSHDAFEQRLTVNTDLTSTGRIFGSTYLVEEGQIITTDTIKGNINVDARSVRNVNYASIGSRDVIVNTPIPSMNDLFGTVGKKNKNFFGGNVVGSKIGAYPYDIVDELGGRFNSGKLAANKVSMFVADKTKSLFSRDVVPSAAEISDGRIMPSDQRGTIGILESGESVQATKNVAFVEKLNTDFGRMKTEIRSSAFVENARMPVLVLGLGLSSQYRAASVSQSPFALTGRSGVASIVSPNVIQIPTVVPMITPNIQPAVAQRVNTKQDVIPALSQTPFVGPGFGPPSFAPFVFPSKIPFGNFSPSGMGTLTPGGGKGRGGVQRKKYEASLWGIVLGKNAPRVPRGVMTGVEIRPVVVGGRRGKNRW